ncbi:MAG: hypothetical protein ACTSW1_16750 [Candidatus Hodarchaeales archaeon]
MTPKRKNLTSSANVAAAAFNLPVMVIAGLFIGYFLSQNLDSPNKEWIIIGSTLVFFVLGILELYFAVKKSPQRSEKPYTSFRTLSRLIDEENDLDR